MTGASQSARREIGDYLSQTSHPGNALLLSVPVLVTYNLGLLFSGQGVLNGADFVTGWLYGQLGYQGYLVVQLVLSLGALAAGAVLRRKGRFDFRHLPVLMAESLVYALTMGTLILFLMKEGALLGPGEGVRGLGPVLVVSAGAGFYEELVFRLALLSGLVLVARRVFGLAAWLAWSLAVLVSSVAFSLAHYAGPESFAWFTFWYRSLAGVVFALVFLLRGFAAAVYTHFLYDVYVLTMR